MELIVPAIISGLLMGMLFALVALGLAIIFGVMDIVNFAHGEFLMVGMYVAFLTSTLLSIEPLLTIPVAAFAGTVLGLGSYYLLVRHLLKGPMLAQLLGTFGLMIFLRYLAMAIFGPDYKILKHGLLVDKSLKWGAVIISYPKVGTAVISVISFGIVYWLINRTRLGMALKATALDAEAAGYMGINIDRMRALAWALGGATVGVAGALLTNFYYVYPTVGILFALIAFATVALGGFGSIKGAFIAGLIMGLLIDLGGTLIGPSYKFALIYLTYFLVVVFRPQGLFGW
ncbi:MAG: branched-chain amino acid ABC transporter permease [Deltaproteobacteria bacterium]|nr:branched-chain amino acid ABC transporter permease [Deltaproteobacteria bacterium]MBW1994590.1 branched-chain amino acid ABC transporter permease [Deltaproteobacteria bacterium]MBW2153053.1 branched-chain amino acid ABC transporter permease [Deltaproteobacteria bacterium]